MKLKQIIFGTIVIVFALLLEFPRSSGSAEESGLDGVYPRPPSAGGAQPRRGGDHAGGELPGAGWWKAAPR